MYIQSDLDSGEDILSWVSVKLWISEGRPSLDSPLVGESGKPVVLPLSTTAVAKSTFYKSTLHDQILRHIASLELGKDLRCVFRKEFCSYQREVSTVLIYFSNF